MTKKAKALQAIDKPRFRYWQALFRAFFDTRLYVDAAKNWKGLGIRYLFFVLAIMLLPFSLRLSYEMQQEIKIQFLEPIAAIPLLFVHNHHLVFDKPMPYLIKNSRNDVVAIIDTTGTIQEKTKAYPNLIALLGEKQITFWPPSSDAFVQSIPTLNQLLTSLGGDTLTSQEIIPGMEVPAMDKAQVALYPSTNDIFDVHASFQKTSLTTLIHLLVFLIYPCLLLFIFIMSFFFLLVFAMMGQLLASLFFGFKLVYSQSCRILAVASTPAVSILWLAFFFGFAFRGIGIIVFILSILYFCYGVMAFKRASKSLVHL